MARDVPSSEATTLTPPPPISPWDGFVAGPENALAQASVQALARGEEPGLSPLVVHGPSGVGKSRLLAALVAECLGRRPGTALAHLEAEAFAGACAEAAGAPGGWAELRERFRRLDLFVLEDVQALDGAPLAWTELVHTLDALDAAGSAVAVSTRLGPGQWAAAGWPSRLVSRLAGGLAVRVDPPGLASRRRYVLERARARGLALSAEAVEALAAEGDGYRTLDGWLARLALAGRLGTPHHPPRPFDRDLVLGLLADETEAAHARGTVTIEQVARAVAARFGVRLGDLRGDTRRPAIVAPRHLAIYLARALTGRSYQAIGTYFGRRDPATVRHACRATSDRLAADPALAAVATDLRRRWQPDEPGGQTAV
jgi:chromosomal replication initiator protein